MADYASVVQKNLNKATAEPVQQVKPVDPKDLENDNAIAMALQESNPEEQEIRRRQEEIAKGDEAYAIELQRQIDTALTNDEAIARELQNQMNKEYNEDVSRMESQRNGKSKVNLSFEKYKFSDETFESDVEREKEEDVQDDRDWDRFDSVDRMLNSIPPCGYLVQNGNFLTKHDTSLNGQKNVMRMMNLPPNVQTGDGAADNYEISNRILNGLKKHSRNEREKGRAKNRRDDLANDRHKVSKNHVDLQFKGVDSKSATVMNKFLKGHEPYLKSINRLFNEGKEAVVFHADASEHIRDSEYPLECALKVFKTVHCDFKQQDQYIRDDYRFKDRYNSKMAKEKIINLWAEKEMVNLKRLTKAEIPCPAVLAVKMNVLLCSFIGEHEIPAPKLKDALLSDEEYHDAYNQIVNSMRIMYSKAKLVHADLSEYNILWYRGKCYFIDVSQAVEPAHDNAVNFLKRDCQNITDFFLKKKVMGTMSSEELFESITGHKSDDVAAIDILQRSRQIDVRQDIEEDADKQGTTKLFDNHWKSSQRNNLLLKTDNKIQS